MRTFDYSFLESGMLPAELLNIVSAIAALRERENERKDSDPDAFTRLESLARLQSVKASNAIEGIVTTEQRILEIVNQNSAPLNRSEAEIAGYRDALDLIYTGFDALDVRENDILRLHGMMLSCAAAAPGAETAAAVEQLISAYTDARSKGSIIPLLLIPCFVLDFLCIQPFADGSGRMSRLLSLLLLCKNGFDAGKYISFEEQIYNGKAGYSEALRLSSDKWIEQRNSYFPFIENFLTTLLCCYKELDKRFTAVNAKKVTKQQRVEEAVLNSLLPMSKQEVFSFLPDISPNTIEAVLAGMVQSGLVEKVGTGRNTKYIKTPS
ncbi:MAG: Fic family protein [Oscillospiraceae bacterium]|nr:Fic family protein [Oscillospiraceae bacterium]